MAGRNAAPDAEDDAGCLGPRLRSRKLFPKMFVNKGTQFFPVRGLNEMIKDGIEPCPFDLLRDADDFPHVPSLVIVTNGTMTSSNAIPPCATISSPSAVNALRSPARRTYRAVGRPYFAQRI